MNEALAAREVVEAIADLARRMQARPGRFCERGREHEQTSASGDALDMARCIVEKFGIVSPAELAEALRGVCF